MVDPDGTATPGSRERRRTHRATVMFAASISCAGTSMSIKLRNLSDEGACIEGEQLPEGTELVLERKGQSTIGRVAWVDRGRCGLQFSETLKVQEALREVPQPRRRIMPALRRPGLQCRQLTEAEKAALERWAVLSPHAVGD